MEGYTIDSEGVYRNDKPAALAIILGNHANAMAISEDAYNTVGNMIKDAVYGGYVCTVVADGTPTKTGLEEKSFFVEDARNPQILEQRKNKRTNELIEELKNMDMVADAPEVDLLEAIREAKNALSTSQLEEITDKRIVIIDTGISTAGDLNFTNLDFLYGKPDIQDIIEQLENYEGVGVLPDLTGINVTFIGTEEGLAEVAPPQEMSTTDKKYIKELWSEIIKACGAEAVEFESAAGWDTPNIYTEDADSKFPYVSTIVFFHEPIFDFSELDQYGSNNPDTKPDLPEPPQFEVELASETIGFKPDRAEYLNESNAVKILRPFAEELKKYFDYYPEEKIWVVGTTATTQKGGEGSISLSLERAETVRETLSSEFDIPEEKLLAVGLGAKFPWAADAYQNGSFDTEIAQSNRAVWLLTNDSDMFHEIKNASENNELLPEAIERLSELTGEQESIFYGG